MGGLHCHIATVPPAKDVRVARYLEPFSLAVAQLPYDGNEGPEIAYRIERFGKT